MDNEKDLSTIIGENINQIKSELGESKDFLIRELEIKTKKTNLRLAVLYINELADDNKLNSLSFQLTELINTLNYNNQNTLEKDELTAENIFIRLKTALSSNFIITEGSDYETVCSQILSGNTVILIDGYDKFIFLYTYGPKGRNITEPTSQTIIRGPKDAFTEKIELNISQIRRKIKDKSVKIENMSIGSITRTNVAVIYLENIARPEIINEIMSRLQQITIDGILDSGYIEELIKDDHNSVFPTFLNSEKPDSVVAGLLEGKVAILVDGSPYVLTAPAMFVDFFNVSEDHYHHFLISSMTRLFRAISFFLTLLVPSTYIALTLFHPEMIPTTLLVSLAAQREGVPFPVFFEAIMMELTFEVLREAGIRMPRAIGQAISIVGALVLGQSAVQAGIFSAVVVIIVSITAISSFAIPNYSMANAIRLLRFILMILSATFGLFGICIGLIVLYIHLCKMKSIGVPYMSPFSPKLENENKDTIVRFPLWKMRYRPSSTSKTNKPRIVDQPVRSGIEEKQEFV
ncbi:MAG: spore germination protein [Ignavibacteriaceae bacterium]|nr:spore germination protein [Ignavibacteriaceae bacterium]